METRMDDMNHILKKGEGFRIVNGKRTYYFRYTDLSKKRINSESKELTNSHFVLYWLYQTETGNEGQRRYCERRK